MRYASNMYFEYQIAIEYQITSSKIIVINQIVIQRVLTEGYVVLCKIGQVDYYSCDRGWGNNINILIQYIFHPFKKKNALL